MRKDGSISVDFSFSGFLFFSVVLNLCWFVNGSRPISPKAPGWIRKVTASTKWKRNLGVISILLLWYCQASPHFNQSRESWKSKIPSAFTNFQSWETNIFHHLPVLSSRRKDIQNPPKLHVYMYIYNCTYMFNGEVRLNLMIVGLWAQFIPPKPNFGH